MTSNDTTGLPWESLEHTEGDIPWPVLDTFADAVAADPSLVEDLVGVYEDSLIEAEESRSYGMFYVPAVLALAAPRLDDGAGCDVGTFLLGALSEAAREDDDLLMEVLMGACGALGPTVLPLVLDAIEQEPNTSGAWFYLWGLMGLAADARDAELRKRAIQVAVDLLGRAERGEVVPLDVTEAAWTLAKLSYTDSRPLLLRLQQKSVDDISYGEFQDALRLLDGTPDYPMPPELWQVPVREWLEPRWRMLRDWYVKREKGDFEESDYDAGIRRAEELADRFMESDQAKQLPAEHFEDAGLIADWVLESAWAYPEASPEQLDEGVLEEVLLEVFPRKITAERDLFEKVAPVTQAFLSWLESEGIIEDAAPLITAVGEWQDDIVANAMNPQFWGMAKGLTMQAQSDGVDIEDEAAVSRYLVEYNRRTMEERFAQPDEDEFGLPTAPIVRESAKIGRNEACPCGSGRKYKNCCGRKT